MANSTVCQSMKTTQSPRKKKQSITTVGLETSIDYFMARTANMEGRHTSVTAVYMTSQKKTY